MGSRSSPNFPHEVEFGAFLIYPSPARRQQEINAKNFLLAVKREQVLPSGGAPLVDLAAGRIRDRLHESDLSELFDGTAMLVPAPGHARRRDDFVWPARSISHALVKVGLAAGVLTCLERAKPTPKAAWCAMQGLPRPSPIDHYDSLHVERSLLSEPRDLIIVDDVITTGATVMAAAARLVEAFPGVRVRAFALARTLSPMKRWVDPCVGRVTMRIDGVHTQRNP